MNIFYLFDDILIMIFSEYISLKELTLLDSSICNIKHRSYFLNLLPKLFPIENTIRPVCFFNWISLKKIKIKKLYISSFFKANVEINLDGIESVLLCNDKYNQIGINYEYENIINKCNNLTSIECIYYYGFYLKINPKILSQLKFLSIYYTSYSKVINYLEYINLHCKSLETLSIIDNNSSRYYTDLINIIKNNPLKKINIDNYKIGNNILKDIKENKNIEYINIKNCIFNLDDLLYIVKNFINLKFLDINREHQYNSFLYIKDNNLTLSKYNRDLTEYEYSLFYKFKYSNLKLLYHNITDKIFLNLMINSYDKLETLDIHSCNLISLDTINFVVNKCTKLQNLSFNCKNIDMHSKAIEYFARFNNLNVRINGFLV